MSYELAAVWRQCARRPGAFVTLIVALGVTSALTTVTLDIAGAYLWRALPYPEADRLVAVDYPRDQRPPLRVLQDADWTRVTAVADLAMAAEIDSYTVLAGDVAFTVEGQAISPDAFELFGVSPVVGRLFTTEEARRDEAVALISDHLWSERFQRDPRIVGRVITARGTLHPRRDDAFTIIGVLAPRFWHLDDRSDLILPLGQPRPPVLMRLRSGVPLNDAAAHLASIVGASAGDTPSSWTPVVRPAHHAHVAAIRPMLMAAIIAMLLLALAAVTNLAFLQVARGMMRQRELAVRAVIGCSGVARLRETAAEAVAVGALASALSVALAFLLARPSLVALERYLGRLLPAGPDTLLASEVVAISIAATMVAAVMLSGGMLVAASSGSLSSALSGHPSSTGSRRQVWGQHLITSVQVASAFALLVGALLLARTAWHLGSLDTGFDALGVLTANVTVSERTYRSLDERRQFFTRLIDRVAALPEVESVGVTAWLPFRIGPATWVEPEAHPAAVSIRGSMQGVTPGYFAALRLRLVEGRVISADDDGRRPSVAVISRSLAREGWPSGSPLGRTFRIRFTSERTRPGFGPFTVVGIVEDVRQSLVEPTPPQVYTSFHQQPLASNGFLQIRTSGDPSALSPTVERLVTEMDPAIPLNAPRPLQEIVEAEGIRPRFLARVIAAVAVLAFVVCLIGVYAVSAWIAQQRQREAALRVALGASRRNVIGLLIRRGVLAITTGIAMGWLIAMPLSDRLAADLHGVAANDLGTRALVALVLAIVSISTLLPPAWRASGCRLTGLLRAE